MPFEQFDAMHDLVFLGIAGATFVALVIIVVCVGLMLLGGEE